jgi:tripartite-type tricarboxylate transporter receptor subunit TctC
MHRRHLGQLAATALAAPWVDAHAQAATFPVKPIKLVIAFPAGGPTDITMRALTDAAGKILGQP